MTTQITLEILQYNYWEHFKSAKNLALTLPVGHPQRTSIEAEMAVMIDKINQLKQNGNSKENKLETGG